MSFLINRLFKLCKDTVRVNLNNEIRYSFLRSFFFALINKRKLVGCGNIIKSKHDIVKIGKNSSACLSGNLLLHDGSSKNKKASCLELKNNSKLSTDGNFSIFYGADILVFENANLNLGRDSFVNSNCVIRAHNKITIGNNCAISHNVTIMDGDGHKIDNKKTTKPIKIGNHVWIGTGSIILKGVTIGDNAVVAAGSVVVHDVEKNSLVAGNPAREVRNNVNWRS